MFTALALLSGRIFSRRSVITREEPFKDDPFTEIKIMVIEERARPKMPEHISEKLASLIKSCWSQMPENRPSFVAVEETLSNLIADCKSHNTV